MARAWIWPLLGGAMLVLACTAAPSSGSAKPAGAASSAAPTAQASEQAAVASAPAPTAAAAPAAATVPAAPAPPAPVLVGYLNSASDAGILLALDKGYFAEQNLDVQLERFNTG